MGKLVKSFLLENGCIKIDTSTFYIGGENSKFVNGQGNTILVGISSKTANHANITGNTSSAASNSAAMNDIEEAIKNI